jgi:hypothetical protein
MFLVAEREPLVLHGRGARRPIFSNKVVALPVSPVPAQLPLPLPVPAESAMLAVSPVPALLPLLPLVRVRPTSARILRRTNLDGLKTAISGKVIASLGTTRFAISISRTILAVSGSRIPVGQQWPLLGLSPGPLGDR